MFRWVFCLLNIYCMENLPTWITLAVVPLICFIYLFLFKKFRYIAFAVGLIVYLSTIAFLRKYKSLTGTLITQQACDTQQTAHIANFGQCSSMLKSTIDLETKWVGRMNCLISVLKKEVVPWSEKAKNCDYMSKLYNSSAEEREEQYWEYTRAIQQ